MGGIKRTKIDAVFSDLIRERADWTCQNCGKHFPERKGAGLHCSHYFGRRGVSTRHHGDNCYALCYACHLRLGSNPHEHYAFVYGQLGEPRYDSLVLRAHAPMKRTKAEWDELYEHLKAQLAYLRRRRKEGEVGLVEFMEFD